MSQSPMRWDASDYAENATAQYGWAQSLISGLELVGDEAILDLGCGDGRISAEIAAGHSGRVLGVDNSPQMIQLATQRYAAGKNLAFRQMDARELSFDAQFDLIFSNAVLHWVEDHRSVLSGIARALRPGGRVVLSMGGKGNAKAMLSVADAMIGAPEWRDYFDGFLFPYAFYGVKEYREWLAGTGLQASRLELVAKDMVHESVDDLKGWIRTTWFPYTRRLPATRRDEFISELVERYLEHYPVDDCGRTHLKMIRLELDAFKAVEEGN